MNRFRIEEDSFWRSRIVGFECSNLQFMMRFDRYLSQQTVLAGESLLVNESLLKTCESRIDYLSYGFSKDVH